MSIAELAASTDILSTLYTAVGKAPTVAEDLSSTTEEFTVFAPSNDAFALVPQEPLMALLEETAALTFILELHIVPGTFMAADLADGDVLETLNGANLTVSVTNGTVMVLAPDGGTVGTVVTPDVEACNGVVHIIDSLLIPGAGAADPATGVPMPVGGVLGSYGDDEIEPVSATVTPPVTTPAMPPTPCGRGGACGG
ncbi:MAG: fasciclin domain-containing protein [Akkermansiaceae bacterium]|nr:fasciclin domain-containing protein [Akkermansiaceae bacterium]